MFDRPAPRLFALPPGADFPTGFVRGLKARMAGQPPEAMAQVTVYLNTAKMRERVRAAFRTEGAGFLPRLILISEIADDPTLALPPTLSPLRLRLDLARLVGELSAREQRFAPGAAVIDLAETLADLIEEMAAEGVGPEALEDPALAEDHADHWALSLRFLRIITPYLEDAARSTPAARLRHGIERLLERWSAHPPTDPVIVAGSTGSRGAAALLMQAVAKMPAGAVVLPGFDRDMTPDAWASLTSGKVPDEDHPQYRFARLLKALDLTPDAVGDWGGLAPDPTRNRLLSLALRPAPVTDQWLAEGASLGPLTPATSGLTLIEAPNPRAEALAIALALREAAEREVRAVLMTPDRTLARRVSAALDRWGIAPDDSAGRPLHLSPPGRLLRMVCDQFGRRLTAEGLLSLIKHPLAATGSGDRGAHLLYTRELELRLRDKGPAFPDGPSLLAWAEAEGTRRPDGAADRLAWATWLADWIARLPTVATAPLSAWIDTLFELAEILAAGPGGNRAASELWRKEAGEAAFATLTALAAEAGSDPFHAADLSRLLTRLLQKEAVRAAQGTHALITIEGTREARELEADLVILAGLNEGTWPEPVAPDPWLSRQMRLTVGLLLPERKIGLAAHDFQIAAAAPQVILSRSARDDEAETVASRWLERLTNLIGGLQSGPDALAAMRARGAVWLARAAALEEPGRADPARRPSPRPPVSARPADLPVTQVSRLIRDPYAVYARYVLRLRRLDPLRAEADARVRGEVLHRIVEEFVRATPHSETAEAAKTRLLAVADTVLAEDVPWPTARALWRARIARLAGWFVRREAERRRKGEPVVVETKGGLAIPDLGFRLTARPDRIDLQESGEVHIYDYKSGAPPSDKQRETFEKQLPLEAAMAERGAFTAIGPRPAAGMTYIRLGGDGEERAVSRDDAALDQEWAGLRALIAAYRNRSRGYTARRAPYLKDDAGDYDQLARFGEWQMSDLPAPENVGPEGDGDD